MPGAAPSTEMGAPHRASAIASHAPRWRLPTSSDAPNEPTIPPTPSAADNAATPPSPVSRRSRASTTTNTFIAPRTALCAKPRPNTSRRSRWWATVRTPSTSSRPRWAARRRRRAGSAGTSWRPSSGTAPASDDRGDGGDGGGRAGRWSAARPRGSARPACPAASTTPRTTLALVSSSVSAHSAGISAECTGRNAAIAIVATTASP